MEYLTLKDIALINMGQSPDSKTYNEEKEGIPFYQGKSDFGKINPIPRVWCSNPIKIAEKDDILISVRAPIGDTNIATEKCCIGRGLASIRPLNENINKKYLYYLLNSKYKELNKFGTGSTFKAITKENLCNLKCAEIPDIKEQIEVVKKLDNVSQIIEIKKKQLEKLSIIIKSQFVEMFGDVVKGTKYNENQKSINDIAFVTKLAGFEFTDYIKYQDSGDIIMLRGLNCKNGRLVLDNIKWIDKEISDMLPRSKLFIGDILMTYAGTIADVAMVDEDDKYHLAPNVAKISINNRNEVNPIFIMYTFMMTHNYIMSFASKTSQPSISMEKIRKFTYYLPPIELQNQFAEFVKQIDKQKFESVIKAEKEIEKIQKNIYYKWGR